MLDVCPISNLRTRAVPSLDAHPLPHLHRAGVRCSLATDDPRCSAPTWAASTPTRTRAWLREIGERHDWGS